jgi:hypothetical protein
MVSFVPFVIGTETPDGSKVSVPECTVTAAALFPPGTRDGKFPKSCVNSTLMRLFASHAIVAALFVNEATTPIPATLPSVETIAASAACTAAADAS